MSRPGASWWPEDLEELPENSPKRCRVENENGRLDPASLARLADAAKTNEAERPKKSDPPENDKAADPAEENRPTPANDIWVVRKVEKCHSDDEETDEGDENENEEPNVRPGPSTQSGHNHTLPGQIEEGLRHMCLHEAAERRLFSAIYRTQEDVNHVNDYGETPLHYAAEIGAASIAGLLLDKGADPNAVDDDGFTPLILAAAFGHAEAAEILIESGADLHYEDDMRMAPIHFAAHGGFADVVRVLLSKGADPAHPDGAGDLPCDYAYHGGHLELAEYLFEIGGGHLGSAFHFKDPPNPSE